MPSKRKRMSPAQVAWAKAREAVLSRRTIFAWRTISDEGGRTSSMGARVWTNLGRCRVLVQAGVWKAEDGKWSWAVHDPNKHDPIIASGSGSKTRAKAQRYAESVMREKLGEL